MYFYLSKILAPFINLVNLLTFSIIFFYFLNIKLKNKFIKLIINFCIISILLLIFTPIGQKGIFYLEKDYLLQNKINKIDNIIVLAGPENQAVTKVTNKLNLGDGSERLIASVKLALENPKAKIYFLGGDGKLVNTEFDETHVAKIFFNDVGFDLKRVKFINNTRNTIENLKSFKKFEDKNKSNILITSAYHMKRATLIAKKLNINFTPYAVDFRSNIALIHKVKNNFSILNYIQGFNVLNGLNSFNIFFREFLGILAFKLFF